MLLCCLLQRTHTNSLHLFDSHVCFDIIPEHFSRQFNHMLAQAEDCRPPSLGQRQRHRRQQCQIRRSQLRVAFQSMLSSQEPVRWTARFAPFAQPSVHIKQWEECGRRIPTLYAVRRIDKPRPSECKMPISEERTSAEKSAAKLLAPRGRRRVALTLSAGRPKHPTSVREQVLVGKKICTALAISCRRHLTRHQPRPANLQPTTFERLLSGPDSNSEALQSFG